jgi:uncharacterized membrane protein YphA (DoxX/SURF4 family)
LQLRPLRLLAAIVLVGQLLPIRHIGHRFWEMDEGPQRMQNQVPFFKNLSIIGGALYIAATANAD